MVESPVAELPVVVGFDGSAAASRAVEWAADEAVRRGVALRIVHATEGVRAAGTTTVGTPGQLPSPLRHWLAAADELVRRRVPAVHAEDVVLAGTVNEVLLAESRHAGVLVVGSRGLERPIESLPTSTVTFAAMHARCPVVVVPADAARRPATAPVVLGVDGSAVSEAAIEFAFDAAASRAATLVAVHAWSDVLHDPAGEGAGSSVGWEWTRREHDRLLAERLLPWQDKHPDVPVRRVVAHDRPITALLRQAAEAGLLVVGSRGRGDFAGMLFGSTSQPLLYVAPCPVAVVRALDTTTDPGSTARGPDDLLG